MIHLLPWFVFTFNITFLIQCTFCLSFGILPYTYLFMLDFLTRFIYLFIYRNRNAPILHLPPCYSYLFLSFYIYIYLFSTSMEGFRVITLSGVKLFHKLLFFFTTGNVWCYLFICKNGEKGLLKKLQVITGTYL